MHVAQDLHRLRRVVGDGAQGAEAGLAHGLTRGAQLGLVEVGLETGLEDVERGGQDGCRCASDAVAQTVVSFWLFCLAVVLRAGDWGAQDIPSCHEMRP